MAAIALKAAKALKATKSFSKRAPQLRKTVNGFSEEASQFVDEEAIEQTKGGGLIGPLLFALNPFSPMNWLAMGILLSVYFSFLQHKLIELQIHETWVHVVTMILAYLLILYVVYWSFCKLIVQPFLSHLPGIGMIFSLICGL